MKFKFTQLPDKLPYPPNIRARLSSIHSDIVTYVQSHYDGTFSYRRRVVRLMNLTSYHLMFNDTYIMSSWNHDDPFSLSSDVDDDILKIKIGSLYIVEKDILWDIEVHDNSSINQSVEVAYRDDHNLKNVTSDVVESSINVDSETVISPTPKSDLYIQPPKVPRFNYNSIWISREIDGCRYTIYCSEPEIPKRQNEISVTTDINKFSRSDLMRLYPNHFIRTRSEILYNRFDNMHYHEALGSIFPINGFKEEQIIDNIIKYPHIFKLAKIVDDQVSSFYTTIEIGGKLYLVSEIWNDLPESKIIPYNVDFIKEYVVRRYLLERDILHIDHKYKLYGSLDPFLTLFMNPDDYIRLGYEDVEDIARKCVLSRVSYKKTRNPILKRIDNLDV